MLQVRDRCSASVDPHISPVFIQTAEKLASSQHHLNRDVGISSAVLLNARVCVFGYLLQRSMILKY